MAHLKCGQVDTARNMLVETQGLVTNHMGPSSKDTRSLVTEAVAMIVPMEAAK
jgi:hypothetical protein